MKNENLNVAPTEKELINAGFVKSRRTGVEKEEYSYQKRINEHLGLIIEDHETGLWYLDGNRSKLIHIIEPTKAAINAEFEHFGEEVPQWEKVTPKVGEVWKSADYTLLIGNNNHATLLSCTVNGIIPIGAILNNFINKGYTKTHDTLDDYCKEKYGTIESLKSNSSSCGKAKAEHVKPEILQKPYSYASLKAQGKIPHDRSGINHDKIEAFSKLLDIKEVIDKEFEDYADDFIIWFVEMDSSGCIEIDEYEKEGYYFSSFLTFTSKKAAEAALKDNKELFEILLNK